MAILLLPWQTRWFYEGPRLGGYPWEGGRWSVYGSWIFLVGTIFFGVVKENDFFLRIIQKYWRGCVLGIAGIFASIFLSVFWRATAQWWIEMLLLLGFVGITVRSIRRGMLLEWIVYAVLPHAVLGIGQHAYQCVEGSKWLGISAQDPAVLGVSVVESAGQRWLRAYGGFPHPNIFGGWLVLGIGCAMEKFLGEKKKMVRLGIGLLLILFSTALVFTFSRSAWLALGVCLLIAAICVWNGRQRERLRNFFMAGMMVMLTFGAVGSWRWPLIVTRSSGEARLEQRSITEREQGLKAGMVLFSHHFLLGVGPRTVSYALVQEKIVSSKVIPVPPHNAFLLILDEIGLVGVLLIAVLLYKYRLFSKNGFFVNKGWNLSYAGALFVVALLDYYLWSTWSGMAWTALIFCLFFTRSESLDSP